MNILYLLSHTLRPTFSYLQIEAVSSFYGVCLCQYQTKFSTDQNFSCIGFGVGTITILACVLSKTDAS
jgi:hypothetical protein